MASLLQRIVSIENGETGVSNIVVVDNLQTTLDTKQDVLTAGTNVSIVDNVISATGGGGGGDVSQSDLDTKQDVLTAGDNISIVDNVISSTSDVSTADLDTKQDVLTAGTNISIVDNVISASGDSTDTTALQSQVDTNTSDISTLQSSKQNTLTAGDNITISGNTISASGGGTGGGSSAYFVCSFDVSKAFHNVKSQFYTQFTDILFQQPTATTLVDINAGQGYTIQEDGLYHIGYSLSVLLDGGTCEIGIVYVRNGVEFLIMTSGIGKESVESRSIIWQLQTGDIVALKFHSGNASKLTIFGESTHSRSNMYGYKIG